jgi:hypothetical protein
MTSERLMTKDFITLSHLLWKYFEVFQSDVTGSAMGLLARWLSVATVGGTRARITE